MSLHSQDIHCANEFKSIKMMNKYSFHAKMIDKKVTIALVIELGQLMLSNFGSNAMLNQTEFVTKGKDSELSM